jgi:nitrite reductase (NO-forming)
MKLKILVTLLVLSTAAGSAVLMAAGTARPETDVTPVPDVTFTLRTEIGEGKLVFVGQSGRIKDQVNPDLRVAVGQVVQITIVNGDGAMHDIAIPDYGTRSDQIAGTGAAATIVFRATRAGQFEYLCTLPGHKAAGMVGNLIVGDVAAAKASTAVDVAQDPHAVGEPVGNRAPQHVTVDLRTTEVEGKLSNGGSTYRYWTFENKVPGPFLRVAQGDTVTVNLTNDPASINIHSIDFHAVTGPGGGAAVTQVAPGETKSFTFTARSPGLYVYHCATPMVAQHISNGMYGLVLVEPEGGLPPVDREFYVMQGELYTAQKHGSRGLQEFSLDKLLDERPEHLMFNGTMDALTGTYGMEANVGETVRIYFGVGGPNLTSSFHVIGEIFDRVYELASLTSPPLTDVQTTLVPPGGAAMVEFQVDYPGRYVLVDHALSRLEKGLAGFLVVKGEADPAVFRSDAAVDLASGH